MSLDDLPISDACDTPDDLTTGLGKHFSPPAYCDLRALDDRQHPVFQPRTEGPSLFQAAHPNTYAFEGHYGPKRLSSDDLLAMGFLPPLMPVNDRKVDHRDKSYKPHEIDAPSEALSGPERVRIIERCDSIVNNIFHPDSEYEQYRKGQHELDWKGWTGC